MSDRLKGNEALTMAALKISVPPLNFELLLQGAQPAPLFFQFELPSATITDKMDNF